MLEHVAGEDDVEGPVPQLGGVKLGEVALHHAVEPATRLGGGAGIALHADHLARAGLLEQLAVVAAAAAEVEHAQSARIDEAQEGGLGVAEVAARHVHRRIIPRRGCAPQGRRRGVRGQG